MFVPHILSCKRPPHALQVNEALCKKYDTSDVFLMNKILNIPTADGQVENTELASGETMFILGANGTGKSSLMHSFYISNQGTAHRITGQRLSWLQSEEAVLTQPKQQLEQNQRTHDSQNTAIWKDDSAFNRNLLSINKLIAAEHNNNRVIATELKTGNAEIAGEKAAEESPLDIVNKLFRYSNIPIVLKLNQQDQVEASRNNGPPYPIARLSDGERNALFLISDVLSVPAGTLILVDEPEKHLHRSIISPLLSRLCLLRSDCYYIVSTHEVRIAAEADSTKILLVRGCHHAGVTVRGWDTDLISDSAEIDDGVRRHILGARRKVLFVEGEADSLDKLMYSVLFPETSVIPMNGCVEVERSVSGLKNTTAEHWIKAAGIIDNDRRSVAEVDALRERGVFALPVHTIESIYYHPTVQRMVAESMADLRGINPDDLCQVAVQALIHVVRPEIQHLSARVVEKKVSELIDTKKPTLEELRTGNPIELQIDVATLLSEEEASLTEALNQSDAETIICKYPIKKTAALVRISEALGFGNRQQYEEAVRKHLMDNEQSLNHVRGYFGQLIFHLSIE